MCLVANDPTLDCDRMETTPFTHPNITPLKIVTKEKQLTNEHKVTWDEYHLQQAVIFHGRAAIVVAVMPQYIEEKEVDYLGYSMESILSLITHIQTCPVITNTERIATPPGVPPLTNISAPTQETSQGGKTTPRSTTSRSPTTIN